MLTILPDWYMEAETILDGAVRDIILKNHINYHSVADSKSIDEAKREILRSLVWIYENVDIENRVRVEEFFEDVKIKKGKKKSKKKN